LIVVKHHRTFTPLRRRRMSLAAITLFISVAGVSTGAAEQLFSFDRTPGRLPKTVVPIHYAIELEPDLENLTLAGSEVVDIEVREPTDKLVLNAVGVTLGEAGIDASAARARIALDAGNETATLTFSRPLAAGAHKLRIAFRAQINKFARGMFLVEYPTESGTRRMISSQLEPADARRVFPCWDEPAFKASIALTVTVPRSFLAVGNMPVAHEEPVTPSLKQITFAPTPKMSTYLFVFAAGELERLSAQADGVTVGVVTTAGKREQGRFALDNAVKLLRYFNDYFGVKYPLPKLDLIAVPGGMAGAMENWGGITFFESRLLFDPASSSPSARRGIFDILAHEMAHQWFGNLVTMGWWDNLWLNEGFASWMQAKAAEHFFPQWRTWLNTNGQKQSAMNLDARRTSHPIQQPVANESEAMAVFDGITYGKGQALIRMLESYLGTGVFRDGIRKYMADHAYGNTTTGDLWQALETASGKPVGAIAGTFTEQAGVPLIIVQASCAAEEQRIHMRVDRFSIHDTDAAPRRWQVPVVLGPLRAVQASETVLLADDDKEIAAGRCGEPVKLNIGDVGYFRVEYDGASRAALAKSLALMAPADRLNLLADEWALLQAGRSDAQSYFELLDEIGNDDDRAVWDQMIRSFARLNRLARGHAQRPALQAYARAILRPVFDRLGWDAVGREDDESGILRTRLIRVLGELNDDAIIAEAKRRFASFLKDPATLRPSLREAVTQLVGESADHQSYDTLLALARKSTNTNERVRYYSAAASARDPALARETLWLALTEELPSTLRSSVLNLVASAGEQPELAWEFVQRNFAVLAAKQGPSFRDYFVSNFMLSFSDADRAAELASFAPVHATSGGRAVAARAQEAILIDAEFKARALPAIDDWIKRRSGAHD
jgi:aminopeptidase N